MGCCTDGRIWLPDDHRLGHDHHLRSPQPGRRLLPGDPRRAAVRLAERVLLVPVQLDAVERRVQLGRQRVDDLRRELQPRPGQHDAVHRCDRGPGPRPRLEHLVAWR